MAGSAIQYRVLQAFFGLINTYAMLTSCLRACLLFWAEVFLNLCMCSATAYNIQHLACKASKQRYPTLLLPDRHDVLAIVVFYLTGKSAVQT
jgi:hypothetical protein